MIGLGLWLKASRRSEALADAIAQHRWDDVLEIDSHNVTALVGRAQQRLRSGKQDVPGAFEDLEHAKTYGADSAEFHSTIATAYALRAIATTSLDRIDNCLSDLANAVSLGADESLIEPAQFHIAELYLKRGETFLNEGNARAALADLDRASKMRSDIAIPKSLLLARIEENVSAAENSPDFVALNQTADDLAELKEQFPQAKQISSLQQRVAEACCVLAEITLENGSADESFDALELAQSLAAEQRITQPAVEALSQRLSASLLSHTSGQDYSAAVKDYTKLRSINSELAEQTMAQVSSTIVAVDEMTDLMDAIFDTSTSSAVENAKRRVVRQSTKQNESLPPLVFYSDNPPQMADWSYTHGRRTVFIWEPPQRQGASIPTVPEDADHHVINGLERLGVVVKEIESEVESLAGPWSQSVRSEIDSVVASMNQVGPRGVAMKEPHNVKITLIARLSRLLDHFLHSPIDQLAKALTPEASEGRDTIGFDAQSPALTLTECINFDILSVETKNIILVKAGELQTSADSLTNAIDLKKWKDKPSNVDPQQVLSRLRNSVSTLARMSAGSPSYFGFRVSDNVELLETGLPARMSDEMALEIVIPGSLNSQFLAWARGEVINSHRQSVRQSRRRLSWAYRRLYFAGTLCVNAASDPGTAYLHVNRLIVALPPARSPGYVEKHFALHSRVFTEAVEFDLPLHDVIVTGATMRQSGRNSQKSQGIKPTTDNPHDLVPLEAGLHPAREVLTGVLGRDWHQHYMDRVGFGDKERLLDAAREATAFIRSAYYEHVILRAQSDQEAIGDKPLTEDDKQSRLRLRLGKRLLSVVDQLASGASNRFSEMKKYQKISTRLVQELPNGAYDTLLNGVFATIPVLFINENDVGIVSLARMLPLLDEEKLSAGFDREYNDRRLAQFPREAERIKVAQAALPPKPRDPLKPTPKPLPSKPSNAYRYVDQTDAKKRQLREEQIRVGLLVETGVISIETYFDEMSTLEAKIRYVSRAGHVVENPFYSASAYNEWTRQCSRIEQNNQRRLERHRNMIASGGYNNNPVWIEYERRLSEWPALCQRIKEEHEKAKPLKLEALKQAEAEFRDRIRQVRESLNEDAEPFPDAPDKPPEYMPRAAALELVHDVADDIQGARLARQLSAERQRLDDLETNGLP